MSTAKESIKNLANILDKVPNLDKIKIPSMYNDEWIEKNKEQLVKVVVFDVETTGLCFLFDEITELACRPVLLKKDTMQPVKVLEGYNGFQEPTDMSLLTPEIQEITGIKPEDVKGKSLDWNKINEMCSDAIAIIAHNAKFDSTMVKKYKEFKSETEWFCSQNDFNWYSLGLSNRKQEILCPSLELIKEGLGFDYVAHRAISDVDALIQLLVNVNGFKELLTPHVDLQVRGFVSGRFYKLFFEPNRFYFRSTRNGNKEDKFVQGTVKENKVEEMKNFILEKAQKERDKDENNNDPLNISFKVVPSKKKF